MSKQAWLPGAADLAGRDKPFGQRSSKVGTCPADGTDGVAAADQQALSVADRPGEQSAVRDRIERDACDEVGLVLLLCHGGPQ